MVIDAQLCEYTESYHIVALINELHGILTMSQKSCF